MVNHEEKNTLTKGLTHPYPTSGDGEESEPHAGPLRPPLMMMMNERHVTQHRERDGDQRF